jgi:hypothetical protein
VMRSRNVRPSAPEGSSAFGRPILDDRPPESTIPGTMA